VAADEPEPSDVDPAGQVGFVPPARSRCRRRGDVRRDEPFVPVEPRRGGKLDDQLQRRRVHDEGIPHRGLDGVVDPGDHPSQHGGNADHHGGPVDHHGGNADHHGGPVDHYSGDDVDGTTGTDHPRLGVAIGQCH
jgi:hypothetical protein